MVNQKKNMTVMTNNIWNELTSLCALLLTSLCALQFTSPSFPWLVCSASGGDTGGKPGGGGQIAGKYVAPGRRDGGAGRGEMMTPRNRGEDSYCFPLYSQTFENSIDWLVDWLINS